MREGYLICKSALSYGTQMGDFDGWLGGSGFWPLLARSSLTIIYRLGFSARVCWFELSLLALLYRYMYLRTHLVQLRPTRNKYSS